MEAAEKLGPAARPPLVLRADAGGKTGTGHLFRSLALADAYRALGGTATLVTCCDNEDLLAHARSLTIVRLEQPHPHPSDSAQLLDVIERINGRDKAYVVLDGYHFDAGYQGRIREAGHRCAVIDDTAHLAKYVADLIVNQNIGAERLAYRHPPGARMLLGTRYALLRPAFAQWLNWGRDISDPGNRVLVTLGGVDTENETTKVIRAITSLASLDLQVVIVIGASNPHRVQVETLTRRIKSTRVVSNTRHMPQLMAWADVAISGGGTTCWELAFMGVPTLVLVLADNQRANGEGLDSAGAMVNLGWHEDVGATDIGGALEAILNDPVRRAGMSETGRRLVDGLGASRVAAVLASVQA